MNDIVSVPQFLARAAQQTGFDRERFVDRDVPNTFSKIVILPFFGDSYYLTVLSSLLLHPYIKRFWSSHYFIVCGFPGLMGLFPYVSEYWSLSDQISARDMMGKSCGYDNFDLRYEVYCRNLRKYFDNVLTFEDLLVYYNNGFTNNFLESFGDDLERFLPGIPAAKIELTRNLTSTSKKKIFVYPCKLLYGWNRQQLVHELKKDFWSLLLKRLIDRGYYPVVYQNQCAYDVSPEFGDKCYYVTDVNILYVMSAMRSTGCVLDVFSGISRLALLARCPFLVCDERTRYVKTKEYEVNDLCSLGSPYRYIMSFSGVLQAGNYQNTIDYIVGSLDKFITETQNKLLSSSESFSKISYNVVRQHKIKKLGCRFVRVERLLIS